MEITKHNQNILNECIAFLSSIDTKKFLIAFSGGHDSSVLLHAMCSLRKSHNIQIRSIHVNHHFHNEAELCAKHCLSVVKKFGLEHLTKDIYLENHGNIEQELREKRYKTIISSLKEKECILTAHHLDDQIETFFLRLMRGSGSKGLTCMEKITSMHGQNIGRPLLNIERSELEKYIKENSIKIFEDETNNSLRFDRNFIRSEFIPILKSRWPSLNKVMKNNIDQQRISSAILSDYISEKLKYCLRNEVNILSIESIKKEKPYVQFSLIHEWVSSNTSIILNSSQVSEIINNLVNSKNDTTPLFSFKGFNIRKYQNVLFLDKNLKGSENENFKIWNLQDDLKFNCLTLKISKLKELGIYKYLLTNKPVTVKRRLGGEKIQLNTKFHQKLKKIFQSRNIPTWERETYALIFVKERLIAAYGPNDVIVSNSKY